jgi:hypothetical protein
MARVKFLEDFDYKPTPQVTVGYTAGWIGTVKRDCADKAVAAKKAELLDAKTASDAPEDDQTSQSGEA